MEYFSSPFRYTDTHVRLVYSIYVVFDENHHILKALMILDIEHVMKLEKEVEYLFEFECSWHLCI